MFNNRVGPRSRGRRRITLAFTAGALVAFSGPCLPDDFWSSLLANSLSAVTGVLLSDFLNVVLPPV